MLRTLQEYSQDKVALMGVSALKNAAIAKPISAALSNVSSKTKKLTNGMVPAGQTNAGGNMLKTAMSGQDFDKEAFLGGIAASVGKVLGKIGPTQGMKNTGMKMMSQHANRVSSAKKGMDAIKSTGKVGLMGRAGGFIARNSNGKLRGLGNSMMHSNRNSNVRNALNKQKHDTLSKGMAGLNTNPGKAITKSHILSPRQTGKGTMLKNNGVPRKTTFQKATKGKIAWGTTPGAASQGARGVPITTKAPTATATPTTTATPAPTTTATPAPQHSTIKKSTPAEISDADQIAKLKKKNKKLKKGSKGKGKGMINDMNKSYKKSALYKDFGYKPVVAGGALAAYSAGGSGGGGAPVVVNN